MIFNDLDKRCDLMVYQPDLQPFIMVECKQPKERLSDKVFWQLSWYNMPFQVPYLVITNGSEAYCCKLDYDSRTWEFLPAIPSLDP